jgi:hypothetical protein
MNDLPLEVVLIILQQLQRWTISAQPFSHLTETSIDGIDGWLKHVPKSRQDICNFRLVSHKLYSSSFSTFGELLGERVFRMTKVGLEDLEAVSGVDALRPHIHTITFGGTHFSEVDGNRFLIDVFEAVPDPDRERLQDAYAKAHNWSISELRNTYVQNLTTVLRRYSNFRILRFLVSDDPGVQGHLGGWLGPGDEGIIAQAQRHCYPLSLEGDSMYQLNNCDLSYFAPILTAIKDADTAIKDVRIGCRCNLRGMSLHTMLEKTNFATSVRRLHHEISPECLTMGSDPTPAILAGLLKKEIYVTPWSLIVGLTHLSLSMTPDAAFDDIGPQTSNLMKALELPPFLQHLTIRGPWSYAEDELVDLVAVHKDNLTQVALIGPTLANGDWASVINRLVPMLSSRMRHLQIKNVIKQIPGSHYLPAYTNDWTSFIEAISQAIEEHAVYTVYVSSGDQEYIYYPPLA